MNVMTIVVLLILAFLLLLAIIFASRRATVRAAKRALYSGETDSDRLYQAGLRLAKAGHLDDAILAYTRALTNSPSNPQLHVGLGDAYFVRQQYVDAELAYQIAFSLDPTKADYRERLTGIDRLLLAKHPTEPFHIGRIQDFNGSIAEYYNFNLFPASGLTLLDLRQAYDDLSTGIREDIHRSQGRGEILADVVLTTTSRSATAPTTVQYVRRPERLDVNLGTGALLELSGGSAFDYICPPDGWVVPTDGHLFHPDTGAPLATEPDRNKALRALSHYIQQHPDHYATWSIPVGRHRELIKQYGKTNFDPNHPTPEQLAECELSYFRGPDSASGRARAVWRRFSQEGPFEIQISHTLKWGGYDLGTRRRTRSQQLLLPLLRSGEGYPILSCHGCRKRLVDDEAELLLRANHRCKCVSCGAPMNIIFEWDACDTLREIGDDQLYTLMVTVPKDINMAVMLVDVYSKESQTVRLQMRVVDSARDWLSLRPISVVAGSGRERQELDMSALGLKLGASLRLQISLDGKHPVDLNHIQLEFV
jgi:tetratricopeptide (TPR) repeat protein